MDNSEAYNGWKILRYHDAIYGREHYTARYAGVTMNTNTLEGMKRMIDSKNVEMRNTKPQTK